MTDQQFENFLKKIQEDQTAEKKSPFAALQSQQAKTIFKAINSVMRKPVM